MPKKQSPAKPRKVATGLTVRFLRELRTGVVQRLSASGQFREPHAQVVSGASVGWLPVRFLSVV